MACRDPNCSSPTNDDCARRNHPPAISSSGHTRAEAGYGCCLLHTSESGKALAEQVAVMDRGCRRARGYGRHLRTLTPVYAKAGEQPTRGIYCRRARGLVEALQRARGIRLHFRDTRCSTRTTPHSAARTLRSRPADVGVIGESGTTGKTTLALRCSTRQGPRRNHRHRRSMANGRGREPRLGQIQVVFQDPSSLCRASSRALIG